MKLNSKELMMVRGGKGGIAFAIGAAIAFLISVIDGFINPVKCRA